MFAQASVSSTVLSDSRFTSFFFFFVSFYPQGGYGAGLRAFIDMALHKEFSKSFLINYVIGRKVRYKVDMRSSRILDFKLRFEVMFTCRPPSSTA